MKNFSPIIFATPFNMPKKLYYCSVSGQVIPAARVAFLLDSGTDPATWTLVEHSQVRRKQAFFVQPPDLGEGEVDSSTLMIVDRIHNDTVRSIMGQALAEAEPGDENEAETTRETQGD